MKTVTKNMLLAGAGVFLLLGGVAAASSYVTRQTLESEPKTQARVHTQPPVRMAASQPAPAPLPACDDKNIVGTIGGGVAGGILGNQIGGGSGKTIATVGGVVGGAVLGNQYLPTRNVTCR